MTTPVLYLLCGLAFSGKTTLAAALRRQQGCEVVSSDEINARRGLHGGDGVPAQEWARTHELALAEVEALMRRRVPGVVVDDTNCFRFLRDDYRALARRHGYAVRLLVLDVPLAEVRRRMAENATSRRRRGLRPEVFAEHRGSFEWPGPEETPLRVPAGVPAERWVAESPDAETPAPGGA